MDDHIPTLVCACGNVMKAPGARPGRVGRCTKCGAKIRVPEAPAKPRVPETRPRPRGEAVETAAGGGYGVFEPPASESVFARTRENATPGGGVAADPRPSAAPDLGPWRAPVRLERSLGGSLAYPLWSWASVGMLAFAPPILTVATAPASYLMKVMLGGSPFVLPAYVSLIPLTMFTIAGMGYVLIYYGDILLASASGEIVPPRPPGLDDDFARVARRWAASLLGGLVVGGIPAYLYWLECGEVDGLDLLMFFNLTTVGVAYAQIALVSTLIHDDPLAANPITVAKALGRLGWGYAGVCLFSVGAFATAFAAFVAVSLVGNGLVHLVLYWLFWVFAVYLGMLVFRRLGLFCHRRKVIRAWFGPRPAPGAETRF